MRYSSRKIGGKRAGRLIYNLNDGDRLGIIWNVMKTESKQHTLDKHSVNVFIMFYIKENAEEPRRFASDVTNVWVRILV